MFRVILHGLSILANVAAILLLGWGIHTSTTASMGIHDQIVTEESNLQRFRSKHDEMVAHRRQAELLERHADRLVAAHRIGRESNGSAGKSASEGSLANSIRTLATGLYCDAWIVMGMAAGRNNDSYLRHDNGACKDSENPEVEASAWVGVWKSRISDMRRESDAEMMSSETQSVGSLSNLESLRKKYMLWLLAGLGVAILILSNSAVTSVSAMAGSRRNAP